MSLCFQTMKKLNIVHLADKYVNLIYKKIGFLVGWFCLKLVVQALRTIHLKEVQQHQKTLQML